MSGRPTGGGTLDGKIDGLAAVPEENELLIGDGDDDMLGNDNDSVSTSTQARSRQFNEREWRTPDGTERLLRTGSESVVSFASSTGSSIRQRRLPPPPPGVMPKRARMSDGDEALSTGDLSISSHLEADQQSVVSVSTVASETHPSVNHRVLESERRNVKFIKNDSERESFNLTYDNLILSRQIQAEENDAYVDTTFCSRSLLEELMSVKYKVRQVGTSEFKTIQSEMSTYHNKKLFYNSDACVWANIDAFYKNCITLPKDPITGESLLGSNELLYVVDLEGMPGGGVEYVLTKKKWEAKVYSFSSIRDNVAYKLKQGAGHFPPESMEQWMGHSSERGDGNIMKPEFINKFAAHVKKTTNGRCAHVVLASGSITDPNIDEDRKELMIKGTAEAEALIALRTLREGGNFILKLYDMFTSFTVGIVYLLYRTFDQISIFRPESCTYGSSERYVVCLGYRANSKSRHVSQYLENCIATEFNSAPYGFANNEKAEIYLLVGTETMRDTNFFYDYVYNSNQNIGEKQLKEIRDVINAISRNQASTLISMTRSAIISKCNAVWGVPDNLRQEVKYAELDATETAKKLLKPYSDYELAQAERTGEVFLMYNEMTENLLSPREWNFVHVGRDRGFYLCKGGNNVYKFADGSWKLVNDELDIAANTLIYADIVDEISQYDGKQIVKVGLHIIDGLVLNGKDIRNLPYSERNELCTKFSASMNKMMADKLLLIRAKIPRTLLTIGDSFKDVHKRQILGRGDLKKKPLVPVGGDSARYNMVIPDYALTGYLLLKTSKSNNAASDFLSTLQTRIYMPIHDHSNMDPHGPVQTAPDTPRRTRVDAATLVHFLQQGTARQRLSDGN